MSVSSKQFLNSIPSDVLQLCDNLNTKGFRAWVVGGCTRDLILGRPVHDWDLTTDARPQQVMTVFRRVIPTGIQHGTVTVMRGSQGYEITTLRGDGSYSDGRHPDSVAFVDELEQDLARRDFTMNAIALDPKSGSLIDPFGGAGDIDKKLIRAVGAPLKRFNEDGLRVLRAARFSATLEFQIEEETRNAMGGALETLRKVSMERVRDELLKTLGASKPSTALSVMLEQGVIGAIVPELLPLVGCEQNKYHAYDVWRHTLVCVDACKADPILRLAALLHDVGKPKSRAIGEKTNDYTFYHHEEIGAKIADAIGIRLKLSNEERKRMVDVVAHHLVVYESSWTDAAVRRWIKRVGMERVADLLEMSRADAHGKGIDASATLQAMDELEARIKEIAERGTALSVKDLKLDGTVLMAELGLKPSRSLGQILAYLVDQVIEEPSVNERERLLALAREWLTNNRG